MAITIITSLFVVWLFLPERFLEFLGSKMKIEFLSYSIDDGLFLKRRSVFAVLIGFATLFYKGFNIYRQKISNFLIGVVSIFVGYLLGIYCNVLLFKKVNNKFTEVDLSKALTFWSLVLMITLVLSTGMLILEYFRKRKSSSN